MVDFVPQHSIVRRIWGDPDLILLVFAGAAAEFALNRAVNWLFYTGRLPADPIGRLFSTARYAQEIVFVDEAAAQRTLDRITAAHTAVERRRGERIPDWAYRDVLYMLIDYSERAYQMLHRPLTPSQRRDLYDTFSRVGAGMQIPDLPTDYEAWRVDRALHLERDLASSEHTTMLYDRYREHLGAWRFRLLVEAQAAIAPDRVRRLLGLRRNLLLGLAMRSYGLCRLPGLQSLVQWLLLPAQHLDDVRRLGKWPERGHPCPCSEAGIPWEKTYGGHDGSYFDAVGLGQWRCSRVGEADAADLSGPAPAGQTVHGPGESGKSVADHGADQ
jgi:ER-bound oxygenase mpaB/B'/Rubber oxygenase, catalytic domain